MPVEGQEWIFQGIAPMSKGRRDKRLQRGRLARLEGSVADYAARWGKVRGSDAMKVLRGLWRHAPPETVFFWLFGHRSHT